MLCGSATLGRLPVDAQGPAASPPTGVRPIPGATLAAPTAILVDGNDRVWVAHRSASGTVRPGGVAVHDRGVWRDASAGLEADADVYDLHATPREELFATGRGAAWRWEGSGWVRRLSPSGCLSPLRLTSLGPLLFGVCAYYPWHVVWPTRDSADIREGPFLAGAASQAAALADGEIVAIDEVSRALLRLPAGGDVHAGSQWQQMGAPAQVGQRRLRGLWSPGGQRLVIVGTGGLVLSYDRGALTVEATGVTDDLRAVWGTEPDGVYAAGASGRLLFRDAGGWRVVPTGTADHLVAIHGRPGGRIVVVSAGGQVLEVVR